MEAPPSPLVLKLHQARAFPHWYTSDPGGSVLVQAGLKQTHVLKLDKRTWEVMGRPKTVTITVEAKGR